MDYILTHDFGTSSLKSVLFRTDGILVGEANYSYDTKYSNNTWAEQDPEDWWKAFCANSSKLTADMDNDGNIVCVAFDGTYPNLICLDKDGRLLCDAMIWQDNRAVEEAEEISARMTPEYANQYRNGIMNTDRSLPKLLWVRKNRPEIYEKIDKFLPCVSQYVIYKLTGRAVADYRTGFSTGLLNIERNAWSDYMLELADVPRSMLPELVVRTAVVGEIPEELAEECGIQAGTKIVIGTGDGDSGDVGMGMLKDGDAYLNGSTSASMLVVNKAIKGSWPPPTSCSGAAIKWMRDVLCDAEKIAAEAEGRSTFDVINEKAAKAPVGSHGVMFLPFLSGERGWVNNSRARGSFTGITLESTKEDIIRAVYEGIAMNLACIFQIPLDAGFDIKRMPMVGGMAKSPELRQIIADVLGVELYTISYTDEAGCIGCAVLGGIGIGIYEDEQAYKLYMRPQEETFPNMENHEKYKELIKVFKAVYEAQEPLYPIM